MRSSTRHAPVPVLLGTQALFNLGFYAVVPFLAGTLAGHFELGAAAIGVILGVRTFAQQGMFLVGGVLTDRLGPRAVILLGCAVRVLGFTLLAWSVLGRGLLPLFVAGTILTGLGGALFSPGLNVLVGHADSSRVRGRVTLFAWLTVVGEVGAILGPILGAALLPLGFGLVAAAGAVLFTCIGGGLSIALPRTDESRAVTRRCRPYALRDRRFLCFALVHCVDLFSYNQLYLLLPMAFASLGAGDESVAAMFVLASMLTGFGQLPVARVSSWMGPRRALTVGYALASTGYLAPALLRLGGRPLSAQIVFLTAGLLIVGHLFANPTALSCVPTFAGESGTGSYYGLLTTAGGVAVLLGNLCVGWGIEAAGTPPAESAVPWLVVAVPLAASAAAMATLRLAPRSSRRAR